jgi:hypothetical protein
MWHRGHRRCTTGAVRGHWRSRGGARNARTSAAAGPGTRRPAWLRALRRSSARGRWSPFAAAPRALRLTPSVGPRPGLESIEQRSASMRARARDGGPVKGTEASAPVARVATPTAWRGARKPTAFARFPAAQVAALQPPARTEAPRSWTEPPPPAHSLHAVVRWSPPSRPASMAGLLHIRPRPPPAELR